MLQNTVQEMESLVLVSLPSFLISLRPFLTTTTREETKKCLSSHSQDNSELQDQPQYEHNKVSPDLVANQRTELDLNCKTGSFALLESFLLDWQLTLETRC